MHSFTSEIDAKNSHAVPDSSTGMKTAFIFIHAYGTTKIFHFEVCTICMSVISAMQFCILCMYIYDDDDVYKV